MMASGNEERGDAPLPVREGLFRIVPPALIGGRCATCSASHFPLGPTCPYCASADVAEATLSDQGRLWAWTSVTALPPGALGTVPYGFGVIELSEGVRVVTRVTEADPAKLHAGQWMHLVIVELAYPEPREGHNGSVLTYAFAPDSDRS